MAAFADVRRIALGLPETEEVVTWGSDLTFRVRGKIFAITGEDADRVSIKATPAGQAELIELDPATTRSRPTSDASAGSSSSLNGSTPPGSSRSSATPGG